MHRGAGSLPSKLHEKGNALLSWVLDVKRILRAYFNGLVCGCLELAHGCLKSYLIARESMFLWQRVLDGIASSVVNV